MFQLSAICDAVFARGAPAVRVRFLAPEDEGAEGAGSARRLGHRHDVGATAASGSPLSGEPSEDHSTEYVVAVIRQKFASGGPRPGERMREAELATALGVSRGTVREALAILE
jgi:hypothetical protein